MGVPGVPSVCAGDHVFCGFAERIPPMNPKTLTLTLATMAVVGCTPTRLAVRQGDHTVLPPLGPSTPAKGQIIAPKRCDLRLVVLSRPLNDEAINKALWSVADEQVLAPESRQMLESNGLRIGLVSGNLPTEVDSILHAPPPNKIEPSQVNIPSGDNSLFCVSPATSNRCRPMAGRFPSSSFGT